MTWKERIGAVGRSLHDATDYLADRWEEIIVATFMAVVITGGLAVVLKTLKWALI